MAEVRKSRARRVLGVIGAVVGTTVTFASAAVGGVLLHLDAPVTRRLVATQVNAALHGVLTGELTIERIGSIGLGGIGGVRARVKDGDGVQVLFVDGVKVRVDGIGAARSALFGKGPITIDVSQVSIDHVDVALDADKTNENLRIANAFQPKPDDKPKPPDNSPSRGVKVSAPNVVLRHAWFHGAPPGAPALDGELSDLKGNAHLDPDKIDANLERVALVTRALPKAVDPRGTIGAHFAMPFEGEGMVIQGKFDGFVAGIPAVAEGGMDGKKVEGRVDIAHAPGTTIGAIIGGEALNSDASLHAEAHGTLPHIDGIAKVTLGHGSLDLDANVDLGDQTKINAKVAARHFDLREIDATLPPSDLGFDGRGNVALGPAGAIAGRASVDTLPGRLDADKLPVIHVRSAFTQDTAWAGARILDPNMPTEIAIALVPQGKTKIIDAQVRSDLKDLSKVPRLASLGTKGSATIRAEGRVNVDTRMIIGHADVIGERISRGDQRIAKLSAKATAEGTIDDMTVDSSVLLNGVSASGYTADSVDAKARVIASDRIVVENASVVLQEKTSRVVAKASRVTVAGSDISVQGASVEGLGEPINASFEKNPGRMHVKIAAPSIDLKRVMLLAKVSGIDEGFASIDGDVALDGRGDAKGELHAKVEKLQTGKMQNGVATVDAVFDKRKVDLTIGAVLQGIATVAVQTSGVELGGRVDDPKSWEHAKGRAEVSIDTDLSRVSELVPDGMLPVSELGGELIVRGSVWRRDPTLSPRTHFTAYTRGLVVAGATAPEPEHSDTKVKGVAPWRSQDVDFAADVKLDPETADNEVSVRLHDVHGNIVALDAKSILPLDQIIADPDHVLDKVKTAPISVRVVVPKRNLNQMPAILGLGQSSSGTVDADLQIGGTIMEPRVDFEAHGKNVKTSVANIGNASTIKLTYDGKAADLGVEMANKDKKLLTVVSHADIAMKDLLEPQAGRELPWSANAKATFDEFPLNAIPAAADQRVRGKVSGTIALDDMHKDAKVKGLLDLKNLSVGGVKYDKGQIKVDVGGGKASAMVRIDQTDGFVQADASAGLAWGAALVPTLDNEQPLEAKLQAKAFRVAALAPFVQGPVAELDGRLEANATAHLEKGAAKLSGNVDFHDGVIGLSALGGSFKDVKAKASLSEDGTVKVEGVELHDAEGVLTASANAKLNGFSLEHADAKIDIPKNKPLDIALQGTPVGRVSASATVDVKATDEMKQITVVVNVPHVDAELPQSLKTGVQDLNPPEKIRVGVFRKSGEFSKLPMNASDLKAAEPPKPSTTKVDVDIKLGEVTVTRGNQVKIIVTGEPKIAIGETTQITGQIELKQGSIDVQGKEFTVERGTVTFQPQDASNPIVVATATWTAEDGTKVFADFTGPVKTGKVNLRSEPSRPKNEVLALILFGSADGMGGTPQSGGQAPDGRTQAATAVGGGFAAQGLSEALDDLAGIKAQARIDSTNANNPRPELEVQVAKNISVKFGHVLGTPPITAPDTNLATVEWRFRRAWSLATTFGDAGKAQLDAVWQKRY